MDVRDGRILLELFTHPFASYEAIGRAIGTTGTAVAARMEGLRRRGVLLGFLASVDARIFQRYWHVFSFQGLAPEPSLAALLRVEDVVSVWLGPPGTVVVNVFAERAESAAPPGLVKLVGRVPDESGLQTSPDDGAPESATLSPLDWRVLDAIVETPRASLAELSRTTGLTPRTIRTRRDALVANRQLIVAPVIDTSREPGHIVYSGYVAVRRRSDLQAVRLPGLFLMWSHHEPPAAALLGYAATHADVREVERALRAVPGALHVEVTYSRGAGVATPRLREWIRSEIARWGGYRRTSRTAGSPAAAGALGSRRSGRSRTARPGSGPSRGAGRGRRTRAAYTPTPSESR